MSCNKSFSPKLFLFNRSAEARPGDVKGGGSGGAVPIWFYKIEKQIKNYILGHFFWRNISSAKSFFLHNM